MKICVIPFDIKYAAPAENIVSMAHALHSVERDTDVVVIPELFTTSFVQNLTEVTAVAETMDGNTVEAVRRWAQFFGFAIVGSFLCKDGEGRFVNRAFFVEPGGDATFYDKRHLFPLSNEDKTYTKGQAPSPVVRFRGWNFKLAVCFDLRFPAWCRTSRRNLYDVLLLPSNWPHSRIHQYRTLLAARAIENQAYAVGANRSGADDYGEYRNSDSAIFDFLGEDIKETRRNGYLYTFLDREALNKARARFPFYEAADDFSISL